MIVGLGCDLAEIERLRRAVSRPGFLEKVFTPAEQREAARYREPGAYYAGRWAAKEAAAKALGCGFGADCSPAEIEILHGEKGEPVLAFSGAAAERFRRLGAARCHLSLSHDGGFAMAVVILED